MIGWLAPHDCGGLRSGLRMERRLSCSGVVSTGFRSNLRNCATHHWSASVTSMMRAKRHADGRRSFCSKKMSIEPGVEALRSRRSRRFIPFPAAKRSSSEKTSGAKSHSQAKSDRMGPGGQDRLVHIIPGDDVAVFRGWGSGSGSPASCNSRRRHTVSATIPAYHTCRRSPAGC